MVVRVVEGEAPGFVPAEPSKECRHPDFEPAGDLKLGTLATFVGLHSPLSKVQGKRSAHRADLKR
jgi:hypothetical protein